MPRQRDIRRRIATLGEINGILAAMKNLAMLELQKLGRFIEMQRLAVQGIEEATEDFLSFHRTLMAPHHHLFEIYLLVGSERGFCGDFNETVIGALQKVTPAADAGVIKVGSRLFGRPSTAVPTSIHVQGAGIAEEVEGVLTEVVAQLDRLQREHAKGYPLGLTTFYHDPATEAVNMRRLLPMPDLPPPAPGFSFAPLLNLAPAQLLPKLVDQYLYAVLHEVLYGSLLVENQRRLRHMEGAMRRLESDLDRLKVRYNQLRQEEIVEEIEVILLSAKAVAAGAGGQL